MGEHLASVGLTPPRQSQQRQNSEYSDLDLFEKDAAFFSQFRIDYEQDDFDLAQLDLERFIPPAPPNANIWETDGQTTPYETQLSAGVEHGGASSFKRSREDRGFTHFEPGQGNEEQGPAKRLCLNPSISRAPGDQLLYSGAHELATQAPVAQLVDDVSPLGQQSDVVRENVKAASPRSSQPPHSRESKGHARTQTSGTGEKDIPGIVEAHSLTTLHSGQSASQETQKQAVSLSLDSSCYASGLRTPITSRNSSIGEQEYSRNEREGSIDSLFDDPFPPIRVPAVESPISEDEVPSHSEQESFCDPLINERPNGVETSKATDGTVLEDPAAKANRRPEHRPTQATDSRDVSKEPSSETILNNFELLPQDLLSIRIRESLLKFRSPPKHFSPFPELGGRLGYRPSSPALHVRYVKPAADEVLALDQKQKKRIQNLYYERNKYMSASAKCQSINPLTGTTAAEEDKKHLKRSLNARDRQLEKAKQETEDLRQQKEEQERTVRRLKAFCYHHGLIPPSRPSDWTPSTVPYQPAAPPRAYSPHVQGTIWPSDPHYMVPSSGPPASYCVPMYTSAPANSAVNQPPVSHAGPLLPHASLPFHSTSHPATSHAVPRDATTASANVKPHYLTTQFGDVPGPADSDHVANPQHTSGANPNAAPINSVNPNVSSIAGTFATQPVAQTAHHPAAAPAHQPAVPLTAPLAQPTTFVSPAMNVIDLTTDGGENFQQELVSVPEPQAQPAPSTNAGPDFRLTMRGKDMDWLGGRNHVKQGYMPGPAINPEVAAANNLAKAEAHRLGTTPSVEARQSQPKTRRRSGVAPTANPPAPAPEPEPEPGPVQQAESTTHVSPDVDDTAEFARLLEEAMTEEAIKTANSG